MPEDNPAADVTNLEDWLHKPDTRRVVELGPAALAERQRISRQIAAAFPHMVGQELHEYMVQQGLDPEQATIYRIDPPLIVRAS